LLVVLVAFILTFRKKYSEFILSQKEKIVVGLIMVAIIFLGYQYLLFTEKREWGNTSRLYTNVYDLKSLVGKISKPAIPPTQIVAPKEKIIYLFKISSLNKCNNEELLAKIFVRIGINITNIP